MTTSLTTQAVDPMTLCAAISRSGISGAKTPEAAFALACIALAEDKEAASNPLAFMSALGRATRDYHIIEGRPSMKAEIMLSRFMQAGGKVRWTSYTDEAVTAIFSHPSGGEVTIEWSIARAKAAGIMRAPEPGKGPSQWHKQPRAMMRSRCISEGVRTVYPAALNGVMEPDEAREAGDSSVPFMQSAPALTVSDDSAAKKQATALYVQVSAIDKSEAIRLRSESNGSAAAFIEAAAQWVKQREKQPEEPVVIEGLPQPEGE